MLEVGVLSEFAETKNNCSACNSKSKVEPNTQSSFVDNHGSSVGDQELVW